MSNKYIIFTDTGSDLPGNIISEFEIGILQLKYNIGGESYTAGLGGLPINKFYQKMRNGEVSTTSQVVPDDVTTAFEPLLEQGSDILYIVFSSGLSGTYNSVCVARDILLEKFPERKIIIVDSLAASLGQGLFVYKAACMKNEGKSIEEVAEWCESNKLNVIHTFTVEDLIYLYRGGRVSRTTQIAGTILGIKPVLHVDDEGHLIPIAKIRGRKQSLTALVDEAEKRLGDVKNAIFAISHGDCINDAEYVRDLVRTRLGINDCIISHVGPVIGSHSGPGTVALFMMGDHR